MPRVSYVNGRYVPHADAAVHIEDRGFLFADSVYEAIAFVAGHFVDEAGHLDRLERSLSELSMEMPVSRRTLKMIMREVLRRNHLKDASFYIQVSRGTAARDFAFPRNIKPTLVVIARAADYDRDKRKKMVRSVITVPDIRWQRRDIKTTGLLAQSMAKQAAAEVGCGDAWMVDAEGFITEGSASNAWIVDKKGRLITRPTAGNAILKGVTRHALQILCKRDGVTLVERPFTVAEARGAAEAFMSSAIAMIVPVSSIDGKKMGDGKIGPVTEKIFDFYMDHAYNPKQKDQKWTPR